MVGHRSFLSICIYPKVYGAIVSDSNPTKLLSPEGKVVFQLVNEELSVNFKPITSLGLILLMTIGIVLSLNGILPAGISPTIPQAHATPPNNPAVLGLFSESAKSNALVTSLGSGAAFRMDVNVTDAGQIKGYDINITFTGTAIHFLNSTFTSSKCPGCLFQSISTTLLTNATAVCKLNGPPCTATGNANAYRLSILDSDLNTPFVSGTGVLFRITWTTTSNSIVSSIHIDSKSIIENPSSVPYNAVDGYVDSRNSPINWLMSESPTTVTIVRPVLGSATQTGTTSVSIASVVGTPGTITFKALSLPINTQQSFSSPTCTAACSSTLTITIHGGAKGAAGTTPSGTYFVPIIGNTTANGMRSTWLKLVIQPPAAPNYTFTTSSATTFTQEAGSFTIIPLTATLTSGANDSISLGTNCFPKLNGAGTCLVTPSAGSFNLNANMNVSTFANAVAPQTLKFNATAITQGTYSEVNVVKVITFTLDLVRTHDTAALDVDTPRNFAYNGISLSVANQLKVNVSVANFGTVSETFTVNATAKVVVRSNPNLRWVDTAGTGVYVSGETVILDSDANGIFGVGKIDTGISYVDANSNGHWDCTAGSPCTTGEVVVYDSDGNSRFNVGKFHNDTVIFGTAPANNTVVKQDFKMDFVDGNNNALWDSGETIFYNSITANGVYDAGEQLVVGSAPASEPVLVGSTPSLGTVLSLNNLAFVDSNYNGVMANADSIVQDRNGNGIYETGEPVARGSTPSGGILVGTTTVTLAAGAHEAANNATQISWDPGSLPRGAYIIGGYAVPVAGEFNFANNGVLLQPFTQKLKGDVNGDCKVDIVDLATVGSTFGKTFGAAGYNANADLDNSKVIDIVDLVLVAGNFGQSCPA
jgi:hypothetical protein